MAPVAGARRLLRKRSNFAATTYPARTSAYQLYSKRRYLRPNLFAARMVLRSAPVLPLFF